MGAKNIVRRMTRRDFLVVGAGASAGLFVAGCGSSSGGGNQGSTGGGGNTVRVGYLHTPAVDTHMWLGLEKGYFEDEGLSLETTQFDTGISLSQAMSGGSIDVAIMGAVISNFPTQGVGQVFLLNDVEEGTAQLWAAPDSGISSVEDLAGKQVATTTGTTAHVFLQTALEAAGVDPDSVELVNSGMPGAVNSFIGGSTPAVALWAPFDLQVQEQMPGAEQIDSAANYYPEAAIAGGWVANTNFYENNKESLRGIVRAWLSANSELLENTEASLETVHSAAYEGDLSLEELQYIYDLERTFTNERWAELYRNGTAADWIGRVEQVFVDIGAIDEFVEPSEFFDPQIFLNTYQNQSG